MSRRWIVLVIVLLFATPSVLFARWIKDKVDLETQDVGKVEFSHFNHLEMVGKNCVACHNAIYHIVTKNNPAFTMKEMEGGKGCGACHNGKKAFTVKGNCVTCHVGGDIAIDSAIGEIPFSHKIHTAAFSCDTCHPAPFKAQQGANQKTSMKQMEQGASCGACHDGSSAFSVKEKCDTCHITKELTLDSAAGETPFSHKLHTAAFGCEACHPAPFKAKKGANQATMAQMEQGASCGACHDGSTTFSVKANCGTCHTSREITIDSAVGEIPFSHKLHTAAFGCDSCHPALFKGTRGASQATMAQMEQGASCGACHDGSTAFSVKANCGTCHISREITIDSTVGEIPFSHKLHTAAFGCDSCHPAPFTGTRGASKATMTQMEQGASCGACHDGSTAFSVKEKCGTCHLTSEIAIDSAVGAIPFSHKLHTAAFGCDACHPAPFKAQQGANQATMKQMEQGASCGACHDGSGAFTVKENCGTCHLTSEITLGSTVGAIPFSHKLHTAAFGCEACHPAPFKAEKGANQASMKQMEQGASCGACHDGSSAFTVKENCGTCHPTREITFASAVGGIPFSHKVHTEAFGCEACHPAPFKAEKGANQASMKQMEKGASCGACHDGSSAFSVKENCDTCHITNEIIYESEAGKAKFSHKAHTGAFDCDSCHPAPFKPERGANTATMQEMAQGKSCGACHDGNSAFSVKGFCAECHMK